MRPGLSGCSIARISSLKISGQIDHLGLHKAKIFDQFAFAPNQEQLPLAMRVNRLAVLIPVRDGILRKSFVSYA